MHKIDTFKSAMGRAKEVRGQLFAFDKVDPERTALVVVDMQNVFVAKGQRHRGAASISTRGLRARSSNGAAHCLPSGLPMSKATSQSATLSR